MDLILIYNNIGLISTILSLFFISFKINSWYLSYLCKNNIIMGWI